MAFGQVLQLCQPLSTIHGRPIRMARRRDVVYCPPRRVPRYVDLRPARGDGPRARVALGSATDQHQVWLAPTRHGPAASVSGREKSKE